MDYIYGKLNNKVKSVEYNGINSDTTNIIVDNSDREHRTIKVDVIKTPGTLTINNTNGESVSFNGSIDENLTIDSPTTEQYQELVTKVNDLENNKVSKISTTQKPGNIVYGRNAEGVEEGVNYTSSAESGSDLVYRNADGRAEIKDPVNDLDIVNKRTATSMVNEGVDSIVSQVVPSSDVAQYIQYTLKKDASEYNGAYARAIETFDGIWIVANNSLYKVNLENLNNGNNPSNFTLETISTEILNTTTDPDTVERTNIQISEGVGADAYICYRVKRTDGSYEIRIRAMDCSKGKVFDYTTVATNTDFGLYEPFICDNYIFYSKEIDAETQDIVFKKFKYNYDTDTFTVYAKEYVLCSGTNQKDDLGNIIPKSRPGFSVVVNVLEDNKDYKYLMLFETNVNNSKAGYPYVIQYMYFKFNGEDSATISGIDHTEPKTLLKSKGEIVNIPYIDVIRDLADAENCRYVITYHTTEGYYGNIGDGKGIHKKIFRAMISKNHIMSGTTLRASDFVDLHTRDVHSSEWSGGWGSVCATRIFNTKGFCLLYASGYNSSSTSVQQTFNITLVQDLKQYIAHYLDLNSSTATDGDTLAKRTSRGFLYAATATDLNANSNPDLVATKGFVGKYVSKNLSSKLDKVTTTATSNRLYAIAPNGSQYTPKLTNSVVNGEATVPIRDENGNFQVGTPKVDGDASNKKYADTKVSKSGDTITGNLTIQGNLSVSGTTTTVDTETLKVKDNVIVTNSDKNQLIDLSGLAINTDSTNTFGIMYNPTSNTVDLGLGTITTECKFTFNENEGLPLAIRDSNSSFTQDHLISWSTNKNKLTDSGIDKNKVKDLTDNITYDKNTSKVQVATPTASDSVKSIANVEYVKNNSSKLTVTDNEDGTLTLSF